MKNDEKNPIAEFTDYASAKPEATSYSRRAVVVKQDEIHQIK
jgi:hypothetical protein